MSPEVEGPHHAEIGNVGGMRHFSESTTHPVPVCVSVSSFVRGTETGMIMGSALAAVSLGRRQAAQQSVLRSSETEDTS